jgi:alpha-D-ribose 1-methylphosphonate 5-triphosphate diphosphatase
VTRVILSGGTVVLPDGIIQGGSVVVEDGRIAEVVGRTLPKPVGGGDLFFEANGRLLLPGLVDLHNDAIEVELSPRPRAPLPFDLAAPTLDRRLAAAGVTTEFAAVFFADMTRSDRTLSDAPVRAQMLLARADDSNALVDQHVLFRVDVWSPASLETALDAIGAARVPLLSLNDHTPGQGQYRNVDVWRRYQVEHLGRSPEEAGQAIDTQMAQARDKPDIAAGVLARSKAAAAAGRIIPVSHDDDTAEKVEIMHDIGVRIGEFPVTLEAARRQRQLGMTIVAGAPNIVRRGSASGNLNVYDLLAEGLVDALCADYHAPSILYAALQLVREELLSLPEAVRMIALNPATAVGLGGETGSLEVGKRADLAMVDTRGTVPVVELTLCAGRVSFWSPRGG